MLGDARAARAVDGRDEESMTALHHAARYGHLEVVRELVRRGADPGAEGFDKLRPLHLCAKYVLLSL